MNKQNYESFFRDVLADEYICINEPMKNHSSFRTGGVARLMLVPPSEETLLEVLRIIRQNNLPYYIIGNGSNILVSDRGVDKILVKIAKGNLTVTDNQLHAQAGVSLKELAMAAAQANLGGLEFAAGIPGTLGGGIIMNAGAYGGELGDFILQVRVLDKKGEVRIFTKDMLEFSYRYSSVAERGDIVLSAVLELPEGDKKKSLAKIEELAARRREKQPLQWPSAGSTFKRPEGHFAGALIEQCGLKGKEHKGAEISAKHAGFIVNKGTATASDVYELMCLAQQQVLEQTGVWLEPEMRLLGEFPCD